MELLPKTLVLCLALALARAAPVQDAAAGGVPDRCAGIEFDAIAPDEKGDTYFFKGSHLWKGFGGPAQPSTAHFKELTGHVDAAFRMHNTETPEDHDHVHFFLDDKVFSYYNHTLEEGYPKEIQEDFPGIPTHLDAAVECPKGECVTDSALFFKGQDVHVYDIATKAVKTKTWSHLPGCTSVLRWLEHYYCFHGHNFTRFNPITGEVSGTYPKDARSYFMRCPNFGHGGDGKPVQCSEVKLDASTSDDTGRVYFFAGPIYMRMDTQRDGLHPFPITRTWKEVTNGVDAVFSYTNKIYMIKGEQVYIYKADAHFTLIEGYPKTVKEELGFEGAVDAAFVCPNEHRLHVIQGQPVTAVVERIEIQKLRHENNLILGFSIGGGIDQDPGQNPYSEDKADKGIYVTRITPKGPADDAGLKVGDKIMQVNGWDMTMVTHDQARKKLTKKREDVVRLLVTRKALEKVVKQSMTTYPGPQCSGMTN